jgi:hypothetical protein
MGAQPNGLHINLSDDNSWQARANMATTRVTTGQPPFIGKLPQLTARQQFVQDGLPSGGTFTAGTAPPSLVTLPTNYPMMYIACLDVYSYTCTNIHDIRCQFG